MYRKRITILLGVVLSRRLISTTTIKHNNNNNPCNMTTMEGKIVAVTGANAGLGFETTKELARRGATVIMACRNLKKAEAARKIIVEETKNDKIIIKELDLSCMKSVRCFAKDMNETVERLDVLVHNAGTMRKERKVTREGFELTLATNHLGPFLLTYLLLDLFQRTGKCRIVVMTSFRHKNGSIDFDDFQMAEGYNSLHSYDTTKLANVLFTKELATRLEGTSITINCCNPGMVNTGFGESELSGLHKIGYYAFKPLFKTADKGAVTSVYLSTSSDVDGISGEYFTDCKIDTPSKYAQDYQLAKKLWTFSEGLLKIKYPKKITVKEISTEDEINNAN